MPARIGLTQHVMELPERGERRDTLDQAWTRVVLGLGATPVPIPTLLDDPADFVADLGLDLVVLTGGNDLADLADPVHTAPERDRLERALIEHALGGGVPLLGICRGLQHLVHATGGTLTRADGHVATTHPIRTVGADGPAGAGVDAGTDWPIGGSRTVNSFHSWAVSADGLGPVLEPLAVAADGTVEAAAVPGRPVVGIMWHPERGATDPADIALLTRLIAEGTR